MNTTFPLHRLLLLVALLVGGAFLVRPAVSGEGLHLRLTDSAPKADSTVAAPDEVRLWFSQPPQEGATRIRLVGPLSAGEELAPIGETIPVEGLDSVFHAPIPGTLQNGEYRVVWRTMAADGHVVNGDFTFQVRTGDAGERR